MNENPEGTPNPLNPNPGTADPAVQDAAVPVNPEPGPVNFTAPMDAPMATSNMPEMPTPAPAPAAPVTTSAMPNIPVASRPAPAPMPSGPQTMQPVLNTPHHSAPNYHESMNGVSQNLENSQNFDTLNSAPIDTMAEPMPNAENMAATPVSPRQDFENEPIAKNSVVEPTGGKKKRTGLIIGVILLVTALICGVAAAVIFLLPKGGDHVEQAMTKLLDKKGPTNVSADGTLSIINNTEATDTTSVDIAFKANLATAYNANSIALTLTQNFRDDTSSSFDIDEVQTENGNIYFKLGDFTEWYQTYINSVVNSMRPECLENGLNGAENCAEATPINCFDGTTDCSEIIESAGPIFGIFELIADEWIYLPAADLEALSGGVSLSLTDNPTQCLVETMADLPSYGNSLAELYKQNQFIEYSTENLGITKKKDALYRLSFNDEKLTNFLNSMKNSAFTNELMACMSQTAINSNVSSADISEIFKGYPTVYVEIDDNNNFTRVYFAATSADSRTDYIADISLSYPANIEIVEPSDYTDLSTVLEQLLTSIFGDIEGLYNVDDFESLGDFSTLFN